VRLRPVHTGHKWLNQPQLERYNLLDCAVTASLVGPMLQELRDHKMDEFWEQEVWPLVPAVMAMQQRGLLVDKAAKTALRRSLRAELAEVDDAILAADESGLLKAPAGKSPHGLNSPDRVAAFLFDRLGLKSPKKTATGRRSADQEALIRCWRDLRKKDAHARPVLENLFHRSKLQTVDERYLEFFVYPDSRVRPTIKMIGTETLRFAYADPPLQQITPEVRALFWPPEGCVYLVIDYSQLEARIQAQICGVKKDLDILASGEDLHKLTAQEIFQVERAAWADLDPARAKGMRNYAKGFRYRLAYGGDPTQVGQLGTKNFCPCPRCKQDAVVNLPPGTIIKAGQRFMGNRPEIDVWRELKLKEVKEHRALHVMGRCRYFFGPISAVKREVFNFPLQFIAAWRMNRATRQLHNQGAHIVMQLHDALVLEVPEGEVEVWSERARKVMEAPVAELGGTQFPVDVEVHRPWGVKVGA
jgi:DNA polymerase-1